MPPLNHIRAFAVHIFTALGAALALGALIFAVRHNWPAMFVCLGIALIVDGIDGTFARRLHVAELLPRWSGEVLDLVVDFTTYVFVPAYAIAAGGLMPEAVAIPAGMLIVVTGALYFADTTMKTDDNYFRGFPDALERGGFLPVCAEAAPGAGGRYGGAARGRDLPAVQVSASDAGQTATGGQYRRSYNMVGACIDRRALQSRPGAVD